MRWRPQHKSPPRGGESNGLLRSRFGRRLLGLFVVCALLPTSLVAILSFHSVADQLSSQSEDRRHALVGSIGRTIYDRLLALESDLRGADLRPSACSSAASRRDPDAIDDACGLGALAVGLRSLVAVPDRGPVRPLFGELDSSLLGTFRDSLRPVQSAVLTGRNAAGEPTIYLAHRKSGSAGGYVLLGEVYLPAIWGEGDEHALPASMRLTVWDPGSGALLHSAGDTLVVPPAVLGAMQRSPTGAFEWRGEATRSVATYWSLPRTRRFRMPELRVVLSERAEDVMAPMAQFSNTFPLVLLASIGLVVILGLSQIRRSVLPLGELQRGTSRIAHREFDSRVQITSGDELEDLAGAFNTMASQLGRQFRALSTAAELDRAVLSSVDTTRIVDTVLAKLPELCACEALAITLFDASPGSAGAATAWVAEPGGPVRRWPVPIEVPAAELDAVRASRERLVVEAAESAAPAYLRTLASDPPRTVVVFPLFYRDELLGLLLLRMDAAQLAQEEEELLQARRLADQVAVALANARMVDQVRFLAFYDSLTRLPNRVLFKERLAQAIARAARRQKLVGVCFLDLDHFSRINDTLGHETGDRLVQDVAARLTACTRRGDSVARFGEEPAIEVARLGGDEFTVMLPDLDEPQDAVRVVRRILESFTQPFRLGGHEVFVTTSAGVAIYPFDGSDIEDLLKNADAAMFNAKEQGRNVYRLYSASMNAEAVDRLRTEQQLRRAVESGEFTMHYQPILDSQSGRITGAEALVRWQHPDLGLVFPGSFIKLCEESGLIVPLGTWILRSVCEQSRAWREAGLGPLTISVNLSGRQLHSEELVGTVQEALRATGTPPESLVLELTESMLMDPAGQVGATIRELAGLGVGLAIDDFGTGYSSLSYLKHFPVGTVKIDQSFVADVTEKADAAAIVTAIIALTRALGMDVVAEGVETESQAAFLRKHGCTKLQGFLFGRPTTPEGFSAGAEESLRAVTAPGGRSKAARR
ncbi:MAG: putative bifunctional diguanylate cyclase/phosphodiesterase [Gemmatimonadales bacterium]